MTFGSAVLAFNNNLSFDLPLPEGVRVMNPFSDPEVLEITKQFYLKYYNDNNPRTFILGINPGRFGAGITGITFTDPIRLETELEIDNSFPKKQELSSVFVYEVIKRYGGPARFYRDFYVTAVCPLGFVRHGKNMNYYDDKKLYETVKPFIVDTIKTQIRFGAITDYAICLGKGVNYKYLKALNAEYNFFKKITAVPHPRFIMQYRMKRKEEFIERYMEALRFAGSKK